MRVRQSNPVNPLETLKESTVFRALEESNNHSPIGIYSLLPVSDWVDSLIDGWGWKKSWYAN
jgi:hypothetical protein